ncbi:hypothetical protein A3D80_00970 [Candidatus Roizmanbacteria bacterium RIFCSPHIGHO2_02_FULL_40_13b]|uniref:Addiction module toxin RelE n=1 Tax=Candidatus Roizmanbacteria bacterium RIFCSPHIGHO2_01_FULL_39_24 TaxID=1802032 RepID=A0A1F7GIP3_9BACT|nr:MAG: hypothetical protein A2799_02335 [Candidatus Roizmanbacteria bacterium RIFCSPHIGHO2_01_FULL_39_24]OGK26267.1 MAG: hypothetical protein A3D80_00970 [Candidatus Roizmanbacteria bacterium RIFCSPHIGHO2_02_FULL_40_13b]OGK48902.1 MAG: hypothetical protein A3A56_01730 [Candidatus Roizmanbacteria bacterium RIFCSPLOWO2_01_FULL_40_32]OGK57569.1 MAG: hypothetical protein A3H83_01965 [Candidatus Roizmanbacteria bacterium RIFCSPLOWO2_02_FULL_39_8]
MSGVTVIYYTTARGENVIVKFLDSLSETAQAKVLRIFAHLEEYGLTAIIPYIKKVIGTDLWEIRILGKDSLRILYIIPTKTTILVLHGFKKKTQKTPPKEISIALSRYREWIMKNS